VEPTDIVIPCIHIFIWAGGGAGGGRREPGDWEGGKLKAIGCAGKSRNDFFTLENNSKSESLLKNIGKSELQKAPPSFGIFPQF